ncbi:MAG: prenyltransferase/squalene oxidase repeat-containing protein [Solirubrobacterales bacterium]
MSWELTCFLLLAAVLAAGFAWYERSRPPSQVVALVAALAALAIAGRIAFAAFPNVKPTTDIVIFAGYALGGAPGFAVGALAALVSNFWFGQGPWTPWQMAGWGLCGVLGAALALGGRDVGRLGLAATCGFAGVAYGALLNFSLMATYGGDLSLQRFGVLEARAVPFDAAHAVGNVALALVAGPAMVRMLIRFRERFEWGRKGEGPASPGSPRRLRPALRGGGVASLLLVALVASALAPARAEASPVDRAANWLASVQNDDGGFGASPGDRSGAEITGWVMMGLEAAGRNPLDVSRGGNTPVEFLRGHVKELKTPGDLARTIIALEGAGVDPREFGGVNLVSRLLSKRLDDGSFADWPNSTAYGVIALRTAGATGGLDKSLAWLRKVQNDDGGWGDEPGQQSNADGTGAVMQALSSGSKASRRGLSYLVKAQRKGGGFPLGGKNGPVNTQSTAWAVEGILAAGGNPASFRRGGASALDYLSEHQESDGHYRYSGASDQPPVWAAAEFWSPPPATIRSPFQRASQRRGPRFPNQPPEPRRPPSLTSPAPAPESVAVSPSESASGGDAHTNLMRPKRRRRPRRQPAVSARGAREEGPPPPPPKRPRRGRGPNRVLEPASNGSSSSSVAGAVVLGLLTGCLLFGAAWAARRGWMRWRYGL